MAFSIQSRIITYWLIGLLVLLGIGTFAYNQYLINNLLKKERSSIELWAKAIEYYGTPKNEAIRYDLNGLIDEIIEKKAIGAEEKDEWIRIIKRAESDLQSGSLEFIANELVIKNRFEVPSIVVDRNGNILQTRNLGEQSLAERKEILKRYRQNNEPIRIIVGEGEISQEQFVYYGESPTIKLLRFFPYVQFGLLALLLGIGYASYSSIRRTEQSNLWVGMAKEAAHQLGTPLSGLYGWITLLREQHKDQDTLAIVDELENDVGRLQSIAERFNKIGSTPELEPRRIAPILNEVLAYMEKRVPQLGKNVRLNSTIETDAKIPVNPELFKWAIENIVKNAMDAVNKSSDEAYVTIKAHRLENECIVDIADSGSGIERKFHQEIFKPGYSTKKRGWGLGLSLTRRIIEDYHAGEVFVLESEPGQGTTIRIVLKIDRELPDKEKKRKAK